MRSPLRFARLLALAALPLAAGCFFEPRSAEQPVQPVSYVPATEPRVVLENLDTALRVRDSAGYMNMIGDAFVYVPDNQAVTDYPGVFPASGPPWDRAKEYAFINALFNNVTAVQSALQDSTIFAEGSSGTTVEWEFIYDIKVTSPGAQQATEYRGDASLTLELVSNFWRLTKWVDKQGVPPRGGIGTLPTSGNLRGAITTVGGG